MHFRYLFSMLLFVSSAVAILVASWNASAPVPLTEAPVEKLACASYAPYRLPGESPFDPTHVVSEARIEADLKLLSLITTCLRTYSTQQGLEQVPKVAQRLNMTVLVGIWIGRDAAANAVEVDAGIALAREFPHTIRAVIVGNEVLLRREQTAERMAEYIDQVKRSVDVPVTYADVWEFWFKNDSLADHVDFVTAHILPFWEDEPVGIDQAVPHVLDVFNEVVARFAGKSIMIGETGWPSVGRMRGPARPGRVEQARFMREWVMAAQTHDIDYNLIEGFDQPWKRRLEGAMGGHWGLLDSQGQVKFPWHGPVAQAPGAFTAAVLVGGALALMFVTVSLLLERWIPTDQRILTRSRMTLLACAVGAFVGSLLPAQLNYLIDWNRFAPEWTASVLFWISSLVAALLFVPALASGLSIPSLRPAWSVLSSRQATGMARLVALTGVLRAALLFGMATFLLLHAFDSRYRGFALELHAVPAAFLVALWLNGRRLPACAVVERWLGMVMLVALPFMLWPELPDNHQAIVLASLMLPSGLYALLAGRDEANGASNQRLASRTATAPGSTE